jgi:hypothetical protein
MTRCGCGPLIGQVLATADVWLDERGSSTEGVVLDELAQAVMSWRAFHSQDTHAADTHTPT